jgi:hypothetical protein
MATGRNLTLPQFNYTLDAETKLFFRKYGPAVARMRRDPVALARLLHGVVIPPHQRQIWRTLWQEHRENQLLGGRGTAKSASLAMGLALRAETRTRRRMLALSASKFRGGKLLMEETADFLLGRLKSQRLPAPFGAAMVEHKGGGVIKREGDRWLITFTTHCQMATIPTGNHESARGWRANWLFLDEADNWLRSVIAKYFEPFLAVGTDFENTADASDGNAMFMAGTATYAYTDWGQTLEDRERMLARRFDAQRALKSGEWKTYFELMNEDNGRLWNFSCAFHRWDYTDLLIPTDIRDASSGEPKFEVHYPRYNRDTNQTEVNSSRIIRFDRRDNRAYIYTYPVEKSAIEGPLDDGLTDIDVWNAENRCMFIRASGTTFPRTLIDRATESELLDAEAAVRRGWDLEKHGAYTPPLLYECEAPCILAVDPARTDDFTAFVVIRIGTMEDANEEYDPFKGTGYTPWNNVIWAEARRHMTIRQIAQKIRDLKGRYNLVSHATPGLAPGIVIDARGAASGTTVHDELARPTPDVDDYGVPEPGWVQSQIIYDPSVDEYKHLIAQTGTWPGLQVVWSSDALNTEWVSFAKGQMEQGKLYIAKYRTHDSRAEFEDKMIPGYLGVQSLKNQLLKIQAKPTKYHLKFDIPGDPKKLENKDDLFKAFLYGVHALRLHLQANTRKVTAAPAPAAIVVRPDQGHGRKTSPWASLKF